jgi:hypothetical protein
MNARTLLSGLTLDEHSRFEELFREPFEHVLGRLRRKELGIELRLCDAMGSVLQARCLSEPGGAAHMPRVAATRYTRNPAAHTASTATQPGRPPHDNARNHLGSGPTETRLGNATPELKPLPHPRADSVMHPRSNDLLRHEHLRDFVIGDA